MIEAVAEDLRRIETYPWVPVKRVAYSTVRLGLWRCWRNSRSGSQLRAGPMARGVQPSRT